MVNDYFEDIREQISVLRRQLGLYEQRPDRDPEIYQHMTVLDDALKSAETSLPQADPILDTPLTKLELSQGALTIMARNGYTTVGDIWKKEPSDRLLIPGLGRKSRDTVRDFLSVYGYQM